MHYLDTAGDLGESSMAMDFQRQRRIEVEAINGAVVRHGQRLGIPTPLNHMILQYPACDDVGITARRRKERSGSMLPLLLTVLFGFIPQSGVVTHRALLEPAQHTLDLI